MCKVYTGYHGSSEIEYSLRACTVDNSLAKARGLSLRTGAQTMLYLSRIEILPPLQNFLEKKREISIKSRSNLIKFQFCVYALGPRL